MHIHVNNMFYEVVKNAAANFLFLILYPKLDNTTLITINTKHILREKILR